MASESTISLYGQTYEQILSKVFGGGSNQQKFQLVYPFIDWYWDTPPAHQMNITAYNILGQIPSWSAITQSKYNGSGNLLYSQYLSMLQQCPSLVVPPDKLEQYRLAKDQLTSARSQLSSDRQTCDQDWELALANHPKSLPPLDYDKWMIDQGWKQTLSSDLNYVNKAQETLNSIIGQQNPEYNDACEAAKLPSPSDLQKPGFVKCTVSGNLDWYPGFIFPNGMQWIETLSQGGGNKITISLKASEASSALKESWAGGAADYGDSFFGIYANGSWHKMDLNTEDKTVSVDITINAITQVPVQPDSHWYNSGYLKILASKGQWNDPFTTKGGDHAVFGKGGLLPLMITGIVAGCGINFSINMSDSTFQRHEEDFKASGGIRIGPFHIGGGYSTKSDSWKHTAENNTFTGESTAKYPFIVGFTVAEPGLS